MNFGVLDPTKDGLLDAFMNSIQKIYSPALRSSGGLGQLGESPAGKQTYKNFLDNCDAFSQSLHSAKLSTEGVVNLKPCEGLNLAQIVSAQDCIDAATKPEMLSVMEDLCFAWCKQIEQVNHIRPLSVN